MNLLNFRSPNHIIIGDAFEHGPVEFNTSDQEWKRISQKDLRGRAHINLLEFIPQLMQIWFYIMEDIMKYGYFILTTGDNT